MHSAGGRLAVVEGTGKEESAGGEFVLRRMPWEGSRQKLKVLCELVGGGEEGMLGLFMPGEGRHAVHTHGTMPMLAGDMSSPGRRMP